MNFELFIDQNESMTHITNNSCKELVVSVRPIWPNRKYREIEIIKGHSFVILEGKIDLSTLSFRWEI